MKELRGINGAGRKGIGGTIYDRGSCCDNCKRLTLPYPWRYRYRGDLDVLKIFPLHVATTGLMTVSRAARHLGSPKSSCGLCKHFIKPPPPPLAFQSLLIVRPPRRRRSTSDRQLSVIGCTSRHSVSTFDVLKKLSAKRKSLLSTSRTSICIV
ncbi:hypothetical protein J6590_063594 [Homalodisca vitripennis]|nr:hypothetical protein J6590_063594 [Homalodisca vitripennis]